MRVFCDCLGKGKFVTSSEYHVTSFNFCVLCCQTSFQIFLNIDSRVFLNISCLTESWHAYLQLELQQGSKLTMFELLLIKASLMTTMLLKVSFLISIILKQLVSEMQFEKFVYLLDYQNLLADMILMWDTNLIYLLEDWLIDST